MTGLAERRRLDEARDRGVAWRRWGPYLSERQWGTVREDYSENGDAWNYFTHDQARPLAFAYALFVLVAVVASIPYWRWLGLIA